MFISREDAKSVTPSTMIYLIMGVFFSSFAALIYFGSDKPLTFGQGVGIYLFGIFFGFGVYGIVCFIGDIREGKTLPGTWALVKKTFKRAFAKNESVR